MRPSVNEQPAPAAESYEERRRRRIARARPARQRLQERLGEAFAKEVRQRRAAKDLTIRELSQRMNHRSSRVVSSAESGSTPRLDTLVQFARALDTTPRQLFADTLRRARLDRA